MNLKKAWENWKKFGLAVANIAARVLLTLLYFVFIIPYGLLMLPFGDPLKQRKNKYQTLWLQHKKFNNELSKQLREQF